MSTVERAPVYLCGTQTDVRFHLSLNVADLRRSVEFFQTLFGCEPAKQRSDYAKFECDDPPLVLSLEPSAPKGSGALNHIGFRVPNSQALVAVQHRLESSGVKTTREDGVECCYAKQTKFWIHDPDKNLWEIYTLEEDIEHRGYATPELLEIANQALREKATQTPPAAKSLWSHRLGQPVPQKLFILDASVDEASLEGTFNVAMSDQQRSQLLIELNRTLAADGVVKIHALTSEAPLDGKKLSLPGPASVVEQVLSITELVDSLKRAGFEDIDFDKYEAKPCFVVDGVAMRETRLVAKKKNQATRAPSTAKVLYKGLGIGIKLFDGTLVSKGVFTVVTDFELAQLQASTSDDFVISFSS